MYFGDDLQAVARSIRVRVECERKPNLANGDQWGGTGGLRKYKINFGDLKTCLTISNALIKALEGVSEDGSLSCPKVLFGHSQSRWRIFYYSVPIRFSMFAAFV